SSYPSRTYNLPAPLALLLSTWLAESAWVYLVLCSLVAAITPGAAFTPAAVLFPYVMAMIATLLPGSLVARRSSLITRHSSLTIQAAVALTALNLLGGTLSVVAVVWWEMYRAQPPLDPAWIGAALEGARDPSGGVLPRLLWLLATGAVLWWRGSLLARGREGFPALASRLAWGTVALLGLLAMGGDLLDPALAGSSLAGYLLFGLASLSAARQEETRRGREGGVEPGWQWGSWVLALLLLAGGFGLAFLFLPQLLAAALGLRGLLVNQLLPLLLAALEWIAHLLGLDKPPEPLPVAPGPATPLPSGERLEFFTLSERLREVGRRLFDLSWITMILYALYSWIKQWRWEPHRRSTGGSTRERIAWRFRISLRSILRRLPRAVLSRWAWLARWADRAPATDERAWTARELYRRLLKWGSSRGVPRPPCSTPREYAATLSVSWPALESGFRSITEGYLQTRYGGLALSEEEMEAATTGWQSISRQGVHTAPARYNRPTVRDR
ncbi:MAG: DUF4129 domain-containing protein, partial [Chloroflexota bacterium]